MKIVVVPSTNIEEAIKKLVPDGPEQRLELDMIIMTIKMFQTHLSQLSDDSSTVELKKVLRFGNETVVITCSNRTKSVFHRLISLFKR